MIQASNIKVAVRIRPLLDFEIRQGHTDSKLEVDQQNNLVKQFIKKFQILHSVLHDRTNLYKNSQFDYVLDQNTHQKKLYDKVGISGMIKQVIDGYHATIFAYGQTGSGKTFTMEGYKYKPNDKGIPQPIIEQGENEGIVPRAIHQLFDYIKQENSLQKKKFTVYCSYLQIYKEKIFDLLNKAQVKRLINDGPGLKLKWNKHDHFTVENLYTFECRSPDDVLALYHFGIRNKVVASHNMNNSSSRSHTMLSLTIEQIDVKNPDNVVMSKLQLVDLAGSERQAFTGNQANKESIDINKSLFTLRQVITALTDKKNQNGSANYIPYRESKLTSLLRQSLGGNSFCLMIACLNPCDQYIEENISTLQYAGKASFISNKPTRNDDPKMKLIEELKKENRLLNEELQKANDTIQFLSQITGNNPATIKQNLQNVKMPISMPGYSIDDLGARQGSASSAITEKRGESSDRRQIITERIIKDKDNIEKFFKDKSETLQNIANMNKPMTNNNLPSAANESKDAITERIIHTVNMMKEVLQSNLSLRETIQKQSEIIDNLNADIFQLQNENEDLRDRVQILEDYTGKDSYNEVSKLVKEKKVLENRVKHLEQTSMNWANFQATRQNFHQQKEKINQSQVGLLPKATLNEEFNDDYEPVRCAINTNEHQSESNNQSSTHQSYQKQKQKLEQINYQKQISRGKSNIGSGLQSQVSYDQSSSDRHQEYKIRTVKSLANAYQQQQQMSQQYFKSRATAAQTTKHTNYQNASTTKFLQQQSSNMNMTNYDKQRNSIGLSSMNQASVFNGNHTQEVTQNDARHKSPVIQKGKFGNSSQQKEERYSIQRQPNLVASQQGVNPKVKKELETAHSFNLPPRSPDKYSAASSHKKAQRRAQNNGTITQNSHRERMNVSADYISNTHQNDNLNASNEHYGRDEDEDSYYQRQGNYGKMIDDEDGTDGGEMVYGDYDDQADAYEEIMKQHQRQQLRLNNMNIRSESGLGQLDVSLPMIK